MRILKFNIIIIILVIFTKQNLAQVTKSIYDNISNVNFKGNQEDFFKRYAADSILGDQGRPAVLIINHRCEKLDISIPKDPRDKVTIIGNSRSKTRNWPDLVLVFTIKTYN
ncbi:MAG: hypothetical protein JEZ09_07860 [Salinivirgaceae bacterium]|nr:hypothetical protein [Salinivirgaceae bacterium]